MARQKLTPVEPAATPELAKDTGQRTDLIDVLLELAIAHERSIWTLIYLAVALAASALMLGMWGKVGGYYPAIVAGMALAVLAVLAVGPAAGYFLWANIRAVVRWRVARRRNESGIPTMPTSGKSAPWFLELGDALYTRCQPAHRAFYRIGIVILAAIGGMYLGKYAGIYYLEIGSAAVFGLGGIAWAVATGYMVAVLIRGAARWRSGRTG